MDQQTVTFYSTIFDGDKKDSQFYKTFYSTLVHFEGLKSVLVSNLHRNSYHSIEDSNIDVKKAVVVQLLNNGVELLKDISDYKEEPIHNEFEEDGDITNIPPGKVPSFDTFKNIDHELKHELVANILKIIRIIISSIAETDNGDLITNPNINYDTLFKVVSFLLTTHSTSLDLNKVPGTILSIFKEVIYFLYDYLIIVTSIDYGILTDFSNFGFLGSFKSLLDKTHPSYLNGEVTKAPTTRLSLETLIRIFSIISILDVVQGSTTDLDDEDKFKQWICQFDQILRYNLKVSHDYSTDLFHYRAMNESFFNWMTSNYLNFTDEYLNDGTIKNFKPANKDLELALNERSKKLKALVVDFYDPLEFLGISLYINTYTNDVKILEKLVNHEVFDVWLCLSSYVMTYQFKSVKLQLAAKVILLVIQKVLALETTKTLTIDEYKWKLCRQRSPIVPINKLDGRSKPLASYILDTLSVLVRFNLNKKLNVQTFTDAVNLIEILLVKYPIDDNYDYGELYKSLVKLFTFNLAYVKSEKLTKELCVLFEIILTLPIKSYLIYEILLSVDKFGMDLSEHETLKELIGFLYEKFDLKNDDPEKINLFDSDFDSPELLDTIKLFESKRVVEPSTLVLDVKDILKQL